MNKSAMSEDFLSTKFGHPLVPSRLDKSGSAVVVFVYSMHFCLAASS